MARCCAARADRPCHRGDCDALCLQPDLCPVHLDRHLHALDHDRTPRLPRRLQCSGLFLSSFSLSFSPSILGFPWFPSAMRVTRLGLFLPSLVSFPSLLAFVPPATFGTAEVSSSSLLPSVASLIPQFPLGTVSRAAKAPTIPYAPSTIPWSPPTGSLYLVPFPFALSGHSAQVAVCRIFLFFGYRIFFKSTSRPCGSHGDWTQTVPTAVTGSDECGRTGRHRRQVPQIDFRARPRGEICRLVRLDAPRGLVRHSQP